MTYDGVFWGRVFRFKGVWNCGLSAATLVGEDWFRAHPWVSAPPAGDPVYRALFLGLAFSFGLGYWRVGTDLTKNHEVVRMGIVGQVWVFAVSCYAVMFAPQPLPWVFLLPGVVDLLFALLFLAFLWTYPRSASGVLRPL